jgi:hypothetical protein
MAIGKQGAYATVEGGIVDFGKITTEAIDKYQTQQALQQKLKQEKEAEAAKLKEARVKDIKPFGDVSLTGNKDLDDVAHQSVLVLRQVYDDNYEAAANGDLNAKKNLNQALSELDKLAEVPKALNTRNEDYTKNSKNYNLNYLSEAVDLGKSLGHGKAVPKSDGHGGLVYDLYPTDDQGNIIGNDPIKKDIPTLQLIQGERIPARYSADDTVADFKKNNQQALIEWYNSSKTMKTGVKDLTPTLKYNIASTALAASKSDDAMAQLMIDAGFGKKSSGYTEEEREKVRKYYETYLTNTFQKEVSQDHKFAPQPSGGSGTDKDKDVRTLTTFKVPSGGIGKGYGISINKKGEGVVYPSITIGNKKITNYNANQFYWNKKGDLVVSGSYESVKTSRMSPSDKKDYLAIQNALLSDSATPEQEEKYNELLETYGSQKIKQATTINKNREDLIEPIATKLGYGSVDEFNSAYRPNISAKPTTTKTTTKKEIKGF